MHHIMLVCFLKMLNACRNVAPINFTLYAVVASSHVMAPRVTSFLGTQLTQLPADADDYDSID